jgi:hypothetical protein
MPNEKSGLGAWLHRIKQIVRNVHPGVLAGGIQRRTGRCKRFDMHLAKVQTIVAVSANRDGLSGAASVTDCSQT